MDALYTATQYQLVSMVLNSLGVQLDPDLTFRLPGDVAAPPLARLPHSDPPAIPRIAPKPVADLTAADKTLLAERLRPDGTVFNLYATLIVHPRLYGPRARFGSYIQRDSGLPRPHPRNSSSCARPTTSPATTSGPTTSSLPSRPALPRPRSPASMQGPDAAGWGEVDRATLHAADELRREAFISDATWSTLTIAFYAPQRLVEILFTVGGYCMTGAAIRSFGIQLEAQHSGA